MPRAPEKLVGVHVAKFAQVSVHLHRLSLHGVWVELQRPISAPSDVVDRRALDAFLRTRIHLQVLGREVCERFHRRETTVERITDTARQVVEKIAERRVIVPGFPQPPDHLVRELEALQIAGFAHVLKQESPPRPERPFQAQVSRRKKNCISCRNLPLFRAGTWSSDFIIQKPLATIEGVSDIHHSSILLENQRIFALSRFLLNLLISCQ
mmetsp:Transcript_27447/g.56250  ORF Transcript_27447/g.56250 Transcript_27447/m.56250 type:complete len:210 (+) Transcript_27447:649-1278(+)